MLATFLKYMASILKISRTSPLHCALEIVEASVPSAAIYTHYYLVVSDAHPKGNNRFSLATTSYPPSLHNLCYAAHFEPTHMAAQILDDTNPTLIYSSGWHQTLANPGAFNSTLTSSSRAGSGLRINFRGASRKISVKII